MSTGARPGTFIFFDHLSGTMREQPWPAEQGGPVTIVNTAICPDLLRYEQIGEADNLRGRVVRAFFHALRLWRVKQ